MRTRREVVSKREVLKAMGWGKHEGFRLKRWLDKSAKRSFLEFKRRNSRRHRVNSYGPRNAVPIMERMHQQDPYGWWVAFISIHGRVLSLRCKQREYWMWFSYGLVVAEEISGAVWHNTHAENFAIDAYKRSQTILRYMLNKSYSFEKKNYLAAIEF